MDGQQNNDSEDYYTGDDGVPQIRSPYPGSLMDGIEGTNTESARLPQETFDHGAFSGIPAQPVPAGAHPSFGTQPETSLNTADFHTSSGWPSPGHNFMYGDAGSAAAPEHPPLDPFEYMEYDEEHESAQAGEHPLRFDRGYLLPRTSEPPPGYQFSWSAGDVTGPGYSAVPLPSPADPGSSSHSSMVSSMETETPGSLTSSSSGGQYPGMYSDAANVHPDVLSRKLDSGSYFTRSQSKAESKPAPKRVKIMPYPTPNASVVNPSPINPSPMSPPMLPGRSGESSRPTIMPKPMTGPRVSKSGTQRSPEMPEGRKTRSSHNLVEKQYRNRLNAQFEGLMNALPENLKTQGSSVGEGDETASSEAKDKRPSKAEVLEMARLHIQSLERERDTLVRERDELLGNMKKLQETHAKGEASEERAGESSGQAESGDEKKQMSEDEDGDKGEAGGEGKDEGGDEDKDEDDDEDDDNDEDSEGDSA